MLEICTWDEGEQDVGDGGEAGVGEEPGFPALAGAKPWEQSGTESWLLHRCYVFLARLSLEEPSQPGTAFNPQALLLK